jgi:hypothetical protein
MDGSNVYLNAFMELIETSEISSSSEKNSIMASILSPEFEKSVESAFRNNFSNDNLDAIMALIETSEINLSSQQNSIMESILSPEFAKSVELSFRINAQMKKQNRKKSLRAWYLKNRERICDKNKLKKINMIKKN